MPNALQIYGFPITEDFPEGDYRVQYFQRSRLEFHPNNPPDFRIVITDLGSEMLMLEKDKFVELPQPPINSPVCQVTLGSQYLICEAFREFFNANGGLDQFGKPISNVGKIGDLLVQYFEHARFEWHPGLKSGQRVVLSMIGQVYFDLHEDRRLMTPPMFNPDGSFGSAVASIPMNELRLNAFPQHASLEPTGKQKIFIIVQDQLYRPVANAIVEISVKLPSGKVFPATLNTSPRGIAMMEIEFTDEVRGVAEVTVIASVPNIPAKTSSSAFRIR